MGRRKPITVKKSSGAAQDPKAFLLIYLQKVFIITPADPFPTIITPADPLPFLTKERECGII